MSDMGSLRILVIGSEPTTVRAVNDCLAKESLHAEIVDVGAGALARISSDPILPDVVLLALGNGGEGLQTLQRLRQLHPDLRIVVLYQIGTNQQVVEVIRMVAQDYITFPFQDFELLDRVKRHGNTNGKAETAGMGTVEEVGAEHFFLSASALMNKVRLQAELLANIDVPVLILGENGTGKGVTAQLIHKLSARSDRPFLKVNCGALAGVLESELFGYERGGLTGATRTKAGKFELCDKGTILLDEIVDMPANLQAKLLHVLQDKQFFRLGGETIIEVDVRVLAATNVDIQKAIAERTFLEDLYYRLSAFTVFLPPLRERREEIPGLLRHFMQRTAAQYSHLPLPFSARLMNACLQYAWPGNLRELQNFVKRYLVMADESMAIGELQANRHRQLVSVNSLPQLGVHSTTTAWEQTSTEARRPDLKCSLRTLKDETEIQAITKTLAETNWNRKRAARLLHISYRGLLYKIRQHAITRAPVSRAAMAAAAVDVGLRQKFEKEAAAVINQSSSDKTDTDHPKPPR